MSTPVLFRFHATGLLMLCCIASPLFADEPASTQSIWRRLDKFSQPPMEWVGKFGDYRSPLQFDDGTRVMSAGDWGRRRQQILNRWHQRLGAWPALVARPTVKHLETLEKEDHTQHHVHVQISPEGQLADGYLLVPKGTGPFPAVFVPFYEPLTSIGQGAKGRGTHDYGLQLVKRGFVTLSIGTPGSVEKIGADTRQLLTAAGVEQRRQPLTLLAYAAANCHTALAQMPNVDPNRIGVIGLSYGGKWSMFASCLYDKFACAVWSDPGIVFDEKNSNVNYWEPWYLGFDPKVQRKPGVPNDERPRTGLYKEMVEAGDDLVDLHALMAPRPVLVSGGTEDPPRNWQALNHLLALNKLLGYEHRVAMTARPSHVPTAEALEIELAFLEFWLKDHETSEQIKARAQSLLAPIYGELKLPGLQDKVEVLRDRWGIPHIYARNSHDLFFAQGFVVAQDRLFQIDLWRRIGCGETAEFLGEDGIEGDRFARLIRYRGDMQAEWQSYSPDTREIATSFTQGINAGIDQFGDKLPIEFQVMGYKPKKWQPEDVLTRMSGIVMSGNWQREVARARLIAAVGVEEARKLAPTDPPQEFAAVPGLDLAVIQPEILRGYQAATRPMKFTPGASESNNWVIDGSLSASGKPMLASDPHRTIAIPSLRYLVHLHAPGWNVIGSGEPGLPGVAIGHNEHVAWGFTIVGTDQSDLYVEQTNPAADHEYKVGDRWEPMQIVRDTIAVKGRPEPVTLELRFTRHGPVIHQDSKKSVAIALRWAGSEPGGAAYLGSLSVARSHDARDLVRRLEAWKIPCLNFVFADQRGEIGWVAAALTPVRKGWNGLLPVPGADGQFEWQGYLKVSELPQTLNPDRHFVATANHNILPPGYTREIAYDWESPFRQNRIEERLTERIQTSTKLTLADFQSIQHENQSLAARQLIGLLKQTAIASPELSPFVKLLTEWDGTLSRESAAAALYSVWMQELQSDFYKIRMPKESQSDRGDLRKLPVMLAHLEQPDTWLFGKKPLHSRDELLRNSLERAVSRTKQLLGQEPHNWTWGALHTVTFRHPLAGLGPNYERAFNLGPIGRPGDSTTPNNTRSNEQFEQIHGASYRHVFDLADWDRGLATSTPGQSGQLGSQHYDDLLPLWADANYFPLAYSREKVDAVTRNRLSLLPASPKTP